MTEPKNHRPHQHNPPHKAAHSHRREAADSNADKYPPAEGGDLYPTSTRNPEEEAAAQAAADAIPLPEKVDFAELHAKTIVELCKLANDLNLRIPGGKTKRQIISEIVSWYGRRGVKLTTTGVVDVMPEGFGFIRWNHCNFASAEDDVYVAAAIIKRFGLRTGNEISGSVKISRDRGEKPCAIDYMSHVEGIPVDEWKAPKFFDQLTALFPNERIVLENSKEYVTSGRVVDIVAPLGKGQRGLIVASPRAGKTILLKEIARSIVLNHPETHLLLLLVDERPEEVTDFEESVEGATIYASTFDEPPRRHIQLAELVLERAKRLVELGKDVVILLDSITRLSRGYNGAITSSGGRIISGGLDSKALIKPKKFFGAARKVEEGGSLTILATALVGTENRMDDVIYEEFKGTGNMEIHLDKELSERRIYPAIHSLKSGTRKDELLYHPDEFKRITMIRRQMASLPAGEAMESLIRNVKNTKTNVELLLTGLRN